MSLADFDNKFAREELGMGSRRPSFRSADSITKRATTPELMPNSGSLNGGDTRRLLSRSLNRSNSSLISIPQRPSSLGKSPVADSRMAKSSDDPNRNSTITENGRVDDNDSGCFQVISIQKTSKTLLIIPKDKACSEKEK